MDFVEVASVDDLEEGGLIRVDVDGSRVLVAVVEGKPYAMGAVCTHERAFLDEGGVVGHEVTCPLHFSCFDVRTGEVTAPPAEDDAPVYEVRVEDGKVLVSSEPVEEPPEVDETISPQDEIEAPTETAEGADVEAPSEEAEPADDEGVPEEAPSAPLLVGPSRTRLTWSENSMERLESMSWLRATSDRLTGPTSSLRKRKGPLAVLDVLHGRWFGHAIHPPLSDLPIGLWTGSFMLDVAGKEDAARLLGFAGTAGGVAALATGIADWSVTDGKDRRLGLLHGLLNTAGLGLQGAALTARLLHRRRQARVLSGAGLAVTYASAYLGGHLVMGRGQMVNHARPAFGPRKWTPAVRERDLKEGETQTVQVGERDVLLYRSDGIISAIEAACSHAGGSLGRGSVEDGVVTCPLHDSRFDLVDGRVLRGPAQYSQPVLETRFHKGWIEVRQP